MKQPEILKWVVVFCWLLWMYWVIFMSHPAGEVKPKGAIYDNMWNSPRGCPNRGVASWLAHGVGEAKEE